MDDTGRWCVDDGSRLWGRVTVASVTRQGGATVLALDLERAPRLLPGQYYLLRLAVASPPGVVEQAYSVCSSPFPPSPRIEIAVREVPGGRASPILAHEVVPGDLLQVRGPYGALTWTEADGGPVVLVGAGTGVAPLAAIVRYAAARGVVTPMTVLCSNRDRSTALLLAPLEELRERHGWLTVLHTFTRSPSDPYATYHRRVDGPMLAEIAGRGGSVPPGTRWYVAGPAGFVLAVQADLGAIGVADTSVSTELHA